MTPVHSTASVNGFEVHTLATPILSLSMIPELGGRIVSIHDRAGDREWLDGWHPEAERRLWKPPDPELYESGPGAGIDECLPTVLPCRVNDTRLPDHGEIWSSPADLDGDALKSGILHGRWNLTSLPLAFERRITLHGNCLRFHYEVRNLAGRPTPFQWAWHPLFSLEPGDEIRFAPPVDHCQSPDGSRFPWPQALPGQDLSRAGVGNSDPPCAKVFIGPLEHACAEIHSSRSVLRLKWTAALFPWAGIWITRGAWKDLHHWAIEPTNLPADRLSDAPAENALTTLEPGESREWELTIEIEKL